MPYLIRLENPPRGYESDVDVSEVKWVAISFDQRAEPFHFIDDHYFDNYKNLELLRLNGVTRLDNVNLPPTLVHLVFPVLDAFLDEAVNIAKTAVNLQVLELLDEDEPWSSIQNFSDIAYAINSPNGAINAWLRHFIVFCAAEMPNLKLIICGHCTAFYREGQNFVGPVILYSHNPPTN